MFKKTILAAVSTVALLSGAAAQADEAGSYAQGIADWQALQSWFASQTGDRAAGVNYWAANRNVPGHGSCADAASAYKPGQTGVDPKLPGDKTTFAAGCRDAKSRFDPIDDRRHADPQYRSGFADEAKRSPLQANAAAKTDQTPVTSAPSGTGDARDKADIKPVEAPPVGTQAAHPAQPVPWQCNAPRMTGYNGPYGTIQGPTGQPFVMGPMPSIMAQEIDQRNQQQCQAALQEQREQAEKERKYYEWLDQQKKIAEAEQRERAKQAAEDARRAAEEQRQREANARAAAEQSRAADAAGGYKTTSFDDFQLDGKKLADEEAKVAIKGVYAKDGETEWLYPSLAAYYASREEINREGVPVLTDDAPRGLRQSLLHCKFPQACAVRLRGKVTWCTGTNAFGTHRTLPCLAADDNSTTSSGN